MKDEGTAVLDALHTSYSIAVSLHVDIHRVDDSLGAEVHTVHTVVILYLLGGYITEAALRLLDLIRDLLMSWMGWLN